MNSSIQRIVISPSDGFAGVLDEAGESIQLLSPPALKGRSVGAANYINRFPASSVCSVVDSNEIPALIEKSRENSLALDFALILFDKDISRSTRSKVAAELNSLLEEPQRLNYLFDVLFAFPLPADADTAVALDIAMAFKQTHTLVATLLESQPRVKKAFEAWLLIRSDQQVRARGTDNVLGALIHHGVFRRLVIDGRTQADKRTLNAAIVLNKNLQRVCGPRISAALVSAYTSKLPIGFRTIEVQPPDRMVEFDAHDELSEDRTARFTPGADVLRTQAESQVERIADLFCQGSDHVANKFLDELIDFQTTTTNDHSHLVKSLCNIANKCVVRGRRDASLECLTRAFNYQNGVDAILYIQVGNAFRDLKEYERALKCYEHAKLLDQGDTHAIQLEIIRLAVAKGDYTSALNQYHSLPSIYDKPYELCALATLYRKMRCLRDARESYWRVLSVDPSYHQARAGLAEATKQSGRHFKAIGAYQSLIRDFPQLDEGAVKNYSLARSFLFRLTKQYRRAGQILNELFNLYPRDSDVNLQLAKLCMLTGDTQQAKKHSEYAEKTVTDDAAYRLFQLAQGGHATKDLYSLYWERDIMPEEKGLFTCSRALAAIEADDYKSASSFLYNTAYTDRLHEDFGIVLKFHVDMRLNSSRDYKTDQNICRIAKRGYPELRRAVTSIIDGDFCEARRNELQMCILIA